MEILNRLVLDHCRGRRIAQTVAGDPGILQGISSDALGKRLKGEQIQSSARYGKHLFILFRNGALAMHFGTNGSLELVLRPGVNAGEKTHRRAGVKLHHRREDARHTFKRRNPKLGFSV